MEREQSNFIRTSDWRDDAVNAALTAVSEDGEGIDVLVREMRRNRPGCATLLLNPDRLQMMRFLETETENVTNLLPGIDGHIERKTVCPYVGWYAAEWEGLAIEIAMPPTTYVGGYIVVMTMTDHISDLQKFAEALENFTIRPAGRCLRYSKYWETAPELDAEIGKVTWDDVILAPKVISGDRDAVEGFFRYKEAFDTLGFPWRRGLLLIGPPGTGKTMLCKAAAAALPDLPFLYVRDFSSENRRDAVESIFERARRLAPCVLAFEDIDGLVNQANRTVFLNELDGFQNNDGLLIIASSNHPGKIDEALLKRPSRFDRVFHIGMPAAAEREAYCRRLLSRSSLAARLALEFDISALSTRVADASDGFTPAYIKEAFISAALRRAQEGAEVLDVQFADAVMYQIDELKKHLTLVKNPDALGDFTSPEASPVGIRRSRI